MLLLYLLLRLSNVLPCRSLEMLAPPEIRGVIRHRHRRVISPSSPLESTIPQYGRVLLLQKRPGFFDLSAKCTGCRKLSPVHLIFFLWQPMHARETLVFCIESGALVLARFVFDNIFVVVIYCRPFYEYAF